MITCKFKGGLGNNMFQIAATLATALKNGDHEFNKVLFFKNIHLPHHEGQFIAPVFQPISHLFTQQQDDCTVWIWRVWKEPEFGYSPIPSGENMCLDGYFQSEKYFSHYHQHIVDAFALPFGQNKGTVSIHVRRGNYLLPEKRDYHPFVGEEYLYNAIVYFHVQGFKNFMVFSDDIPWCRQFFEKIKSPGHNFNYSEGHTDVADLVSMSHCEHHIIANSSFSWWGAWLNRNPGKKVVAPKRWFGPAGPTDTQDLLPENWITL